jgi:hypothetical protein
VTLTAADQASIRETLARERKGNGERTITVAAIEALLVEVIVALRHEEIVPLERRIAALESYMANVKHVGTWCAGVEYKRGNFVTCEGSTWWAHVDTNAKPGTSDHWQLTAKRGKDARDIDRRARNRE